MNGADVQAAMQATIQLLHELELPYSLIAAIALGINGKGRATHDVDVLVHCEGSERMRKIREFAASRGFSVDEVWQENHPDLCDVQVRLIYRGIPVDVMFPRDAHDRALLSRRVEQPAGADRVWVVTREDFILQKLKVGRPRDFDDVIPFFAQNRDSLDQEYLNQWALRLGVQEELDYLWGVSERDAAENLAKHFDRVARILLLRIARFCPKLLRLYPPGWHCPSTTNLE